ncbi:alpha/beta hydrolase [Pseudomonas sp. CAU 1711]|uniref:alpha/beta hydrolase n=1 Tax=Pseudomonas sp. CAU 1711 TaxID=3140356 RepID=UPI0032608831
MEVDAIVLPNGNTAKLAAKPTLTPVADQNPKPVELKNCRAIAFFIGGAGDKESYYFAGPYKNITYAQDPFNRRMEAAGKGKLFRSIYRGYNEVRGSSDIKRHVVAHIPDKATPVYIVGHSLGGWNGAHLSNLLAGDGYRVEMLITLDPVGEGALVWLGSDIHYSKPEPKSGYWINVRAEPSVPDPSDSVAEFGEKWSVHSGPDINCVMNVNHANAWGMFLNPIQGEMSAADYMYESVISYMVG